MVGNGLRAHIAPHWWCMQPHKTWISGKVLGRATVVVNRSWMGKVRVAGASQVNTWKTLGSDVAALFDRMSERRWREERQSKWKDYRLVCARTFVSVLCQRTRKGLRPGALRWEMAAGQRHRLCSLLVPAAAIVTGPGG